jgi:hypothetical protein
VTSSRASVSSLPSPLCCWWDLGTYRFRLGRTSRNICSTGSGSARRGRGRITSAGYLASRSAPPRAFTATTTPYCPTLQASITSPANDATFGPGSDVNILFSGAFTNACGSIPSNDFSWYAHDDVINTNTFMGNSVSLSYTLAPSTYTITLQVYDPSSGKTASASISISIQACPALQASITYPSPNQTFSDYSTTATISFTGTYTSNCGSIPDADITWSYILNGNGAAVTMGHGTSLTYTFTLEFAESVYTIQLMVYDPTSGQSQTASIQIGILQD